MKSWDENGLDVQVQYTNPLQVGRGNDNIATSLRNTALFAPTSGADHSQKRKQQMLLQLHHKYQKELTKQNSPKMLLLPAKV